MLLNFEGGTFLLNGSQGCMDPASPNLAGT